MRPDQHNSPGDGIDHRSAADVLGSSLTLPCGTTLANRLVKAATTELLGDAGNRATDAHAALYGRWSAGGAGLLLTGNVQIDRRHLEHPGNVVIEGAQSADRLSRLGQWAEAAKSHGSQTWMQLAHAGRQTHRFVNAAPSAPSAVPLNIGIKLGTPVALEADGIRALVVRFADAARVARDTGFDGVELHAAHGYLFSQFLSPLANRRTDAWGGDLSGRARFLLETVRAVRAAVGSGFPVAVKLNSADFQRGGFAFEESQAVAGWLDESGIDVLEISGGTYEQPRATGIVGQERVLDPLATSGGEARESYFAKFAPEIRKKMKRAKLMVTGGFTTAEGMADAIRHDGVDLIGLARAMCIAPDAPAALLRGEKIDLRQPEHRIGPSLLGPRSPIKMVRALNTYAAGTWYAEQLRRMGRGLEPDPRLPLPSIRRSMKRERDMALKLASDDA